MKVFILIRELLCSVSYGKTKSNSSAENRSILSNIHISTSYRNYSYASYLYKDITQKVVKFLTEKFCIADVIKRIGI